MINVKNLSDFLTKNVHPHLHTSIYILSLTGSLVAYSTPTNTRTLRDQAAFIQLSWQEYSQSNKSKLRAIIMESESQNVIVRAIKNGYILVLVGPSSGQRQGGLKTTPEFEDGEPYPPFLEDEDAKLRAFIEDAAKKARITDVDEGEGGDAGESSEEEENQEDSEMALLRLQKRKTESLRGYLEKSLGDAVAVEDMDYSKLFQ